jgi:hypothetical protein
VFGVIENVMLPPWVTEVLLEVIVPFGPEVTLKE